MNKRVTLNQARIAERILINGNCNLVNQETAAKCNEILKAYLSQNIYEEETESKDARD